MPDLETRLPELLRDLSGEAPTTRPDGGATLRRAGRRRALNAASAVALAMALAIASVAGFRALAPASGHTSLGTASHATPGAADLPPAVEATRHALIDAAKTYAIPTLLTLLDPDTFSYNADDGSNPVILWKEDPSVLDAIPRILALPPAKPRVIQGYGTFYVWPYLVDSDLSSPSPQEIDDLHSLGFGGAAIERMRQEGRYTGPRLSIDGDGLWRSYSTGGKA